MTPDSFPGPGHDGEGLGASPLRPAGENAPEGTGKLPADDHQEPEQGLFVCLPAEELSLAGFAQDGRADTMAPGPLLAAVVHAVTGEDGAGLAGLADDQLVGVISAARRMESRAAWTLMAAMGELARRRPSTEPGDTGRAGVSDFAADEVAGELHLTWQSAADQIAYAREVAERLPRCFAALAAGQIHPVHLRIIEDETALLSPADAAAADEQLAGAAGSMTFGRLRSAAHRLVLELDPEAASRRKEAAKKDTHVRHFREDSGNGGMIARELPPDEVLASWQHVERRALALRAAGMPGTLQELRVKAYLDLLQERDSRVSPGEARHPGTRWCVTALHPDGTAAAHGCARGRHLPPGTAARGDPPGPDPPPGVGPQDYLRSLQIQMVPIARGRCDHTQAETGYQPSRALQHLIRVRSPVHRAGLRAARCPV